MTDSDMMYPPRSDIGWKLWALNADTLVHVSPESWGVAIRFRIQQLATDH